MTRCEEDITQCPVFRSMSPDERQHVQQISEQMKFDPGQTILREGDGVPQGLWMLQRGACQVIKELDGGAEQQLALLEPGAIFGEMSFFDPAPHSATIRTAGEAELMFLPAEKIEALRVLDLSAAYKLIRNAGLIMAGKLRRMDRYTLDLFPAGGSTHESQA